VKAHVATLLEAYRKVFLIGARKKLPKHDVTIDRDVVRVAIAGETIEGKLSGFVELGARVWKCVGTFESRLPLWMPSRFCDRTSSEVLGEPGWLSLKWPERAVEKSVHDALVAAARHFVKSGHTGEARLCLRQAMLGCESNVYEHPKLADVPKGFDEALRKAACRMSKPIAFVQKNEDFARSAGYWIAAALEHATARDPIDREGAACEVHDALEEDGEFVRLSTIRKKHGATLEALANDPEPYVRSTARAAITRLDFMMR